MRGGSHHSMLKTSFWEAESASPRPLTPCSQHFQKLRKDSRAKFDGGGGGGALGTPSRKRKDTPARSAGKGKGAGELTGGADGLGEVERDDEESPLKKVKGAKTEDAGDGDAFT